MLPDRVAAISALTKPDNRDLLGTVFGVSGSQAIISLSSSALYGPNRDLITVGKFLKIHTSSTMLVGIITTINRQIPSSEQGDDCYAVGQLDLIGELQRQSSGVLSFVRGVGHYPTIGDLVHPMDSSELRVIFDDTCGRTIGLGSLQQDSAVTASVNIDEILTKNFAVLGSTGVGKSTALAHILLQIMEARPQLRILLLDAHSEFRSSFKNKAHVINSETLRLPFWLFNFEEVVDIFFGARASVQEELDILSEVIPLAKAKYSSSRPTSDGFVLKKANAKYTGYTVDTPVPYRLTDLIAMIDERMGKLENRSSRMTYYKLITRIEAVSNDPRYAFMFENANVGGDTMAEAISELFRLPANGKNVTIMQLAGFPAEVLDAVVSVISRLAFDFGLWSDGANPMLFVCEEAHKYAPADKTAGFAPTRRALSRIAKEGRKYGVHLCLVTQRPAELDSTIISQCGTVLAMRMSNERDQAFLRSAVSDTAANLFAFVPTLGTREAIVFGVGIPLPTRLKTPELPPELIPRSEAAVEFDEYGTGHELNFVASVLERWRGTTASRKVLKTELRDEGQRHTFPPPSPQSHQGNQTIGGLNRLELLKKSMSMPEPSAADTTSRIGRNF